MNNAQRPAYPVVYEHDDCTSEQPGLTKEEYARIEMAKALVISGLRTHAVDDIKEIDRRARYIANLLVGGE